LEYTVLVVADCMDEALRGMKCDNICRVSKKELQICVSSLFHLCVCLFLISTVIINIIISTDRFGLYLLCTSMEVDLEVNTEKT